MFKRSQISTCNNYRGLVWGTTFLGIRIAVETIPPWFVAEIRQLLAGAILLLILFPRIKMDRLEKLWQSNHSRILNVDCRKRNDNSCRKAFNEQFGFFD